MARIAQLLGFVFFLAIMGWGAWATLYDKQMHGESTGNLPEVGSPVLPTEVIAALPYVALAILALCIVAALLTKSKPAGQTPSPRRRASDFDEDDPDRPKIDDAIIAAAAARYHAEQSAISSQTPAPQNNGPVTFGRRKTD